MTPASLALRLVDPRDLAAALCASEGLHLTRTPRLPADEVSLIRLRRAAEAERFLAVRRSLRASGAGPTHRRAR